jgi:hypothetical protein
MAPKLRSTTTVSLPTLLALAAFAAAADEPKDAPKPGARVNVNKERVKCAAERVPCKDGSKTKVVVEQDVSVTLEIKQNPTAACAATADFEYQQRDTVAHVTGAIDNAQCAASGGDYVMALTIRDASGEVTTLEFPQEWARTDAQPVKFTHDLPIGKNVELQNVRARRLRCTCAEPPEK